MNTGFLGPAVATVLTACGIETFLSSLKNSIINKQLQQYLPLAVLKPTGLASSVTLIAGCNSTYRLRY